MALPASTTSLSIALSELQNVARFLRSQAQQALSHLQANNIDSLWVFSFLDTMRSYVNSLNSWAGTPGINGFATTNIPGYSGSLTADVAAVAAAGQDCIDWIVTSFPKDGTDTFILAFTLNSDGTRTPRQFTPTETAGLQTLLQAFINTIG